jgi:hypothetical protein
VLIHFSRRTSKFSQHFAASSKDHIAIAMAVFPLHQDATYHQHWKWINNQPAVTAATRNRQTLQSHSECKITQNNKVRHNW